MVKRMKNPISKSTIITAVKKQVWCDLAGGAAILDLKSGVYYGLNTVGTRIWDLVQEPRSVDHVLHTLLEEYDVEPERCERDLLALMEELAARGLIEVQNGVGEQAA